jgi:plastocyanin
MRRLIAALVAIAAAAFITGPALGASEAITTTTECCSFGKAGFTIDRGTTATFENLDPGVSPHNVTAVDTRADGQPLFASFTIKPGQIPVRGTDSLPTGTYRFFCSVHPIQMWGELSVTPSASPTVAVKVLSRKLGAVASSGKLKVKVRGLLASNGVSLKARLGKRKLGSRRGIDLSAGASRTVKLPLSRSGKNLLRGRASAKVKMTATPPGDQPVSAAQRLR